jgi:hypothetical protein
MFGKSDTEADQGAHFGVLPASEWSSAAIRVILRLAVA